MAASASAATVTRYQASLRSPHNALHSPSNNDDDWGERSEAPHGRYIWDFPYIIIIGASAAKPHMDDTSALAPHGRYIWDFPYIIIIIIYRRTSDRSNFALRRTARTLTAHAHRCVKLKHGRPLHARPGQGKLTRLLGCYWLSGKLIGSLHTHASHTWLLAVIQH